MTSHYPVMVEIKQEDASSSSRDEVKERKSAGVARFDRRIVFSLQDASHVSRVCDEMDA